MLRAALALAAIAASGCSYAASFDDCAVACRAIGDCPSGLVCGPEGFCRVVDGAGGTCAEVRGDAGIPPPGDGPPGNRCLGTPSACATFTGAAACGNQDGCTHATATCTLATNCSAIMTNLQCQDTPGCTTDFATSTCVKRANYCVGATKADCEDTESCAFAGGCGGTPAACAAFAASEAACRAQAGCTWN
jgi:hypothetical protein